MPRHITMIAAAVLLVGCGGGEGADTGAPGGGEAASPEAACTDLTGAEAVITMVDNEFDPSCAVVSSDQSLSVVNEGASLHSFTLETGEVDVDVQAGETAEVEPLEAGTHDYVCKYHPGMEGQIRVE